MDDRQNGKSAVSLDINMMYCNAITMLTRALITPTNNNGRYK